MRRRGFLALAGSSAAAVAVWLARPWRWIAPVEYSQNTKPALPAQHRLLLGALAETLLPAAQGVPGASELGVMTFVDRELLRADMQGARRVLLRGAAQLDRVSRAKTSRGFLTASAVERELVVRAMLLGEGAATGLVPRDFIRLMLALVLEGALADPVHGGNRGGAGFKLAGWEMRGPTCQHESCP